MGGYVSLCMLSVHICEAVGWVRMSVQSVRGVSRVCECVHMWYELLVSFLL